jgi:hypothetical protein
MPEMRLVVLAVQDRLAFGPTFEAALRSLFGAQASSLNEEAAAAQQQVSAAQSGAAEKPSEDVNVSIQGAARDLEDYQRLTAQGKLGEAGQKLEQLKNKLNALSTKRR